MRHRLLWIAFGCCAAGAVHAQADERQLVDITAWKRNAPGPDAISLVRQREPETVRERVLPASRSVATELKAIAVDLDHGGKIVWRGRKLQYRNQF